MPIQKKPAPKPAPKPAQKPAAVKAAAVKAAPVATTKNDIVSTVQGKNMSVGMPTGTRRTLNNDAFGGPTSGPGAPLPSSTPNPKLSDKFISDYGTPAGANMTSMISGYETSSPATSTFQGGTSGGMGGGVRGGEMPPTPSLGMPLGSSIGGSAAGTPAGMTMRGATFKRGGAVRAEKMSSGGMTSKASPASKRGDGIAQRGKTKGRMC